ncbi:MAG: helix-turn-helix domain-containing protein [Planctomycetaceae bacterium]
MEALSLDLRRRVADALDQGGEAIASIARRFRVSRRCVYQFIDLRRQTGEIVARSCKVVGLGKSPCDSWRRSVIV